MSSKRKKYNTRVLCCVCVCDRWSRVILYLRKTRGTFKKVSVGTET
jgi:hypothetical protein